MSATKALRGVEAGARLGWVVVAGVAVLLLWRLFKPRGVTVTNLIPPAPPNDASSPPEPRQQSAPQGVTAGGLVSSLRAQIVEPAEGGRADRRMLSSKFDATIEVVNQSNVAQSAQIRVVIDFDEFAGGSRVGIETLLPTISIPANGVRRLDVELESGNVNSLTYEFGQAYASARVFVNGKQTQGTSFEVW